ncbi:MAG: tol-pal system protein YbgF [Rhodospirillales bacterium]|nr:MAG: tol-pal system protein YbgF [Rhodospirillales bacterium]
MRQVERLRKDLNDLQRYVYRGGGTPAAAATAGDTVGTDVAARMQLQISKMQEQLRSMNGRVEEIQHRISVLEQRLDRMADDLEIRLQQIEDAVATGGGGKPLAAPAGVAGGAAAGGAVSTQPPASPAALGLPADASAREQYDFAFDLLKKRDYGGASVALQAFLDKNPDDPLAGNAIYWLGETHYVQKEYKTAAKVFLDGYQKYPTGAKAPDNLLKLGMSLAAYGDTGSACKTFSKLLSTFPQAPVRITKAAKNEQNKLNCN